MSLFLKPMLALVLLLAAAVAGDYFAGWLLVHWFSLERTPLAWDTYWRYTGALDQPRFAPYALSIKVLGYLGFGLPLLLWLGLLTLLFKYGAGGRLREARAAAHENRSVSPATGGAPGIPSTSAFARCAA